MTRELRLLAFDLGSSGGRAVVGCYDGSKLVLEVVHRFANGPIRLHGSHYWDVLRLYEEVQTGLARAVSQSGDLSSLGFSTWGVDYALLDEAGKLLSQVYSYRDDRTEGLYDLVFQKIPKKALYEQTGIMFIRFNTLVQLYADLIHQPWLLAAAKAMLMMPDLFAYFLTGRMTSEVTIASTTQMFSPRTFSWIPEIPACLGISEDILQPIIRPGEVVGTVLPEITEACGCPASLPVIAVGGHDTASAIAATPMEDPDTCAFVSAGTWSLLGMELDDPITSEASLRANFTNEVGVGGKIAFHKIIAGMWLIQKCRKEWEREGRFLSYPEINDAATSAEPFRFFFDPDDPRLMNPPVMTQAIAVCLHERGIAAPESHAELARGIYESLALNYRYEIEAMEQITGKRVKTINIVGGGSRSSLLCQLTADVTGRPVVAGPDEATSMGNILSQLAAKGEVRTLTEGRDVVRRSTNLAVYHPLEGHRWQEAYGEFCELKKQREKERGQE